MAWTIAYLVLSFKTPLPWNTIDNGDIGSEEVREALLNTEYFKKDLLQASPTIDSGESGLVWLIVVGLFLSYVIVYFAIWKGVESSGKIVYVTAPLPYVLLLILLIRVFTLGGASKGLKFLFLPDW